MPLVQSLIGLGVSLAVFTLAAILTRRPPQIGRPRVVPWMAIMFAAILAALLFARHLITLTSINP